MNSRLAGIRTSFKGIDGFLVTDINNVRYFTGFSGSSGFLLITRTANFFVTDFRYKEQAGCEVKGWDIVIEKEKRAKTVSALAKKLGIKKVGFESSVSYGFFDALSKKGIVLKPFKDFIERLRAVKEEREKALIKEAVRRAESAFLAVKPYIRTGAKEKRLAVMLEENLKREGCKCVPFDIIIASGRNSSMPHARPSEKKLEAGDLVVIDWGGEAGGYFSDMTRTLLIRGSDTWEKRKIYKTVLEANRKAVSAISAGIDSREIDNSARDVIKQAGYAGCFGHGTGHGVGLQVHESPYITWNRKETIKENMVFTVEPGIYVPGTGGVRIEDMVLVRPKGAEVLTKLPRELEVI
ncbi:MAG: aminopeptidase P family protein [Nitrospiraceae bacterium]|nr:MAG: aminopeptidase P family protein [Nitrospiraceae bacterium]